MTLLLHDIHLPDAPELVPGGGDVDPGGQLLVEGDLLLGQQLLPDGATRVQVGGHVAVQQLLTQSGILNKGIDFV